MGQYLKRVIFLLEQENKGVELKDLLSISVEFQAETGSVSVVREVQEMERV